MSFKIVRNDLTKMNTEAIVNTASEEAIVGAGCDSAVYQAAGFEELLAYRKENIGYIPEGEVFITPGFALPAKYIIHAVSPLYLGGEEGEEKKLRSCYQKSLQLAVDHQLGSISFPLISTGSFGYPKEEGMRIAVDEIHAFLLHHDMDICLVVFDDQATALGEKLYPNLEEYINQHYVEEKHREEYGTPLFGAMPMAAMAKPEETAPTSSGLGGFFRKPSGRKDSRAAGERVSLPVDAGEVEGSAFSFAVDHENRLNERMKHLSDTFSQYLMYLIREKKMENAEVYKRAIVDKKVFSKIRNNADYHIIFSYFIEHQIYDMIELDIQLEEHGLPCIIS